MSAIDILRDALFGNPPQPNMEPSREGVLAAFASLTQLVSVSGIADGVFTSTAAGLAATEPGELFLVAGYTSGNFADLYGNDAGTAVPQGISLPSAALVDSLAADSRVLTDKVIEHDDKFTRTHYSMTLAQLGAVNPLINGFTVYITDASDGPYTLTWVTTGSKDPNGIVNTGPAKWFNHSLPNGIMPAQARSNTIAVIGDSRGVMYIDEDGARLVRKSSPIAVASARDDQRFQVVEEFAESGKRPDEFLDQLDDAIALRPGIIYCPSVYNGIAQNIGGVGGTTAANDIIAAARQAVASGAFFAMCSEVGSTNLDTTRQAQADVFNNMVSAAAAALHGFDFVDVRPWVCGSNNVLLEEYTYDKVHLNGAGDVQWSIPLLQYLRSRMPYAAGFDLDEFALPRCGGYNQLAPNPLLLAATGGTASPGVTGTFAGSCHFDTDDTATLSVASSVGKVVLTGGFGAQGDAFSMEQVVPLASWASGDVVRAMVLLKSESLVNCAGLTLSLIAKGDNVETRWADLSVRETFTWRGTDGGYRYVMLTDEHEIPAYTTKQSLTWRLSGHAYGAGGAVVDVRQVGVLKKQ